MATQFLLQPNGKWAIYSTVIDQLTCVDSTEDELIELAGKEAKERAEESTRNYLKRKKDGSGITQFSVDWYGALAETRKNCTDAEWLETVEKVVKECSK